MHVLQQPQTFTLSSLQKRKAETPPNTLSDAFARQEKQDNLRRLQLQVQEAEAQAIAARAQLEAANANNIKNSSTYTDTAMQLSTPEPHAIQPTLQPIVHTAELAVMISGDETNSMQGALEWEDEIEAIHALEDAIAVGACHYRTKKIANASDLLSQSANAQPADTQSATTTAAKKENRAFKPQWTTGRPWLVLRNSMMFCTACETAGKQNVFTTGAKTFKIDHINKHEGTEDHKMASAAPKQADEFLVARANAIKLEVRDISCSLLIFIFSVPTLGFVYSNEFSYCSCRMTNYSISLA